MHQGKRDKLFQNSHPLLLREPVMLSCIICPFNQNALSVAIFFVIINCMSQSVVCRQIDKFQDDMHLTGSTKNKYYFLDLVLQSLNLIKIIV